MSSTMSQQALIASNKQRYLETLDREVATTVNVLRAYPAEKSELRPHEKLKNARELAWLFTMEAGLLNAALRDELDVTAMGPIPPAPASLNEVISAFQEAWKGVRETVVSMSDESLAGTVRFFTAPHTLGDVPKTEFIWFLLHDMIHHRGQFSVYLRMADGKVPSIYGPTADEPWY